MFLFLWVIAFSILAVLQATGSIPRDYDLFGVIYPIFIGSYGAYLLVISTFVYLKWRRFEKNISYLNQVLTQIRKNGLRGLFALYGGRRGRWPWS